MAQCYLPFFDHAPKSAFGDLPSSHCTVGTLTNQKIEPYPRQPRRGSQVEPQETIFFQKVLQNNKLPIPRYNCGTYFLTPNQQKPTKPETIACCGLRSKTHSTKPKPEKQKQVITYNYVSTLCMHLY